MKSKYIFILCIVLLAMVTIQCKSRKDKKNIAQPITTVTDTNVDRDSLYASIERTPCFGTCPSYKISIYESGYTIYHGKRFVKKIGVYSTRISERKVEAIKEIALALGYFEFDDEYVNPLIADLPSCITSVRNQGTYKTIKVNHEDPPKNLIKFQKGIDSLFEGSEWVLLKDEKEMDH
ncbi:MAG: hypothetical protein HKN22_07800 [Bacteroidia bacterium]|nr:hypothetical protein [Bacteroidia bacterium]